MKILQYRKFFRIHFVLLVTLLVGAGSLFRTARTVNAQLTDHSFFVPEVWIQDFTRGQGWAPEYPRILADVNGDHSQDIVGFGIDGTLIAKSTGTSFTYANGIDDFGFSQDWRTHLHVRTAGDVNGDQLDDIVGFGNKGVFRSLSNGDGFESVDLVVNDFGYEQGWRNDKHVRLLADINGDTRKDIVGFGNDGVWVSFAIDNGDFTEPLFAVGDFGYEQGWRNDKHVRTTADINGDTMQDLVGFGDHGVWIAMANGWGFDDPQFVLDNFALLAGGWQVSRHPRFVTDINKDEKDDIVGFGNAGVWISYSNGNGFDQPQFALADFGYHQGWRVGRDPVFEDDGHAHTGCEPGTCPKGANPRFVVDLNGDGYRDIVGFGHSAIYRSLNGPNGFGPNRAMLRALVTAEGFPWRGNDDVVPTFYPRMVGDVDNDGMTDLVAFDHDDVKVVRSSDQPPPDGPNAPISLDITEEQTESISLEWEDKSDDERKFIIRYDESPSTGNTRLWIRPENSTSAVITGLKPDTKYCFRVFAENIFGVSAPSNWACGKTKPEPEPTPTPTPSPTGIKEIQVFNCHLENRPVWVWTFDFSQNLWTNHGMVEAISTRDGSCDTTGKTPFIVPLQEGHNYFYVAVDPELLGCSGNNPNDILCRRSMYQTSWLGDPNGPPLVNTVN